MMKKKVWTKKDRKMLKDMVKEGKSNTQIAEVLGRTAGAIGFQKSVMGVKAPVERKEARPILEASREEVRPIGVSTRDQAKEMARAARQIARANGKRITMAMFFVEDI